MKQFCFIICTNNDLLLNECLNYLDRLYVPEGYTTDLITIKDAPSMTAGYNAAMKESEADYKIYLHQDLFIANRYFLYNILDIFNQDPNISIIGMAGAEQLPQNAIMWTIPVHGAHNNLNANLPYVEERVTAPVLLDSVVVDGAIIVTSKDVEWREDLFDGFDFYDASECLEHRRKGYRIVVPFQKYAWCIHDDGVILNLLNYNHYRKIFLSEYDKSEFLLHEGDAIVPTTISAEKAANIMGNYEDNKDLLKKEENSILAMLDSALKAEDSQRFIDLCSSLYFKVQDRSIDKTANIAEILTIATAMLQEKSMNMPLFSEGILSVQDLLIKYSQMVMALIRIETLPDDELGLDAFQFIDQNNISAVMINCHLESALSIHPDPELLMNYLSNYYYETGNIKEASLYLAFIEAKKHPEKN